MRRLIIFLVFLSSVFASLRAQYTVGGETGYFKNLSEAFNYLNIYGADMGNVELQLIESTTEPAPATLNKSGSDGLTFYSSVLIYPVNSNLKIEFSDDAPLIDLNGACNVTIDGRVNRTGAADLTIVNTSNGTNASTIRFVESASNNTIEYCKIKGAGLNEASGTIFFSTDETGTGNDNNTISNNLIGPADPLTRPLNSIFSLGSSAPGHENSNNVIINNDIFDFLNKSFSSSGVYVSDYSTDFLISGNSFYETTSFAPASHSSYYGIRINNPSGTGFMIKGNFVGGKSQSCGGTAWTKTKGSPYSNNSFSAISLNAGSSAENSIQGNTIKNFNWTNSGNAAFYGINVESGSALIGTTDGNIIGDVSVAGSITVTGGAVNTTIYGISISGGGPADCRNNSVNNILNNTAAPGSSINGLYMNALVGTNSIAGNFIHNLFVSAISTSSSVYGIRVSSGTSSFYNNIISLGGNTQSAIYGISESGTGNNNSVYSNTIHINGSPTTGSSNSYCIYSSVTTNTLIFKNNIFFNERSNSGSTGTHYAAYITSTTGTITGSYNDYYAPGTGGIIGYYGGDQAVLPVITGEDAGSLAINPQLASAGGAIASNYLPAATLPGISGTGITTDFNGSTRNATPTMGALEGGIPCSNPATGGIIAGEQTGCNPYNPLSFTSTAPGTGASGGSVEYKWQQSVSGAGSGFTDIPGATGATYDAGILTQTTWFKRLAKSSCKPDWTGAAESNVISVTVNEKPAVSISGASIACGSTVLTATTNASSPSYKWYKDLALLSETGSTLTVTSSGSYRVEVTDGATSCNNSSASFPVAVNLIPSASLSSDCSTTTLTAVSDASNASFTWYKDNIEIPGQTTSTLIFTAGGIYKFKVVNGTSSCENTSANVQIPLTDRVVNGTTTVCAGTSAIITIDLSEPGINYQLRNSAGNVNIGSTVSGNGGTITMSTGILPSTTTINIFATRVATGCNVQLTETETITVDPPTAGGTISGASASVEYGSSTGTMTLTGYTGSVLKWQKQLDSGEWQDIANTSASYSETPSSKGSWQYRVKVKSGVCPEALSIQSSTAVSPKPLSIRAVDQEKTYGSTFTFSGNEFSAPRLVAGDVISGLNLSSPGAAASAGVASSPYSITPSGATGTGLENYTITYVSGAMNVMPAALTIKATNKSKTYGAAYTFDGTEFTASGLKNSDAVASVTLTSDGSAYNAGVSGSPYSIVPSSAMGTGLGNYNITYVNGELTVNPASLTITASDQNKTYGNVFAFSGNEFTSSGLISGDAVSVVSFTSQGAAEGAAVTGSPYDIVPSAATGTGLGNYTISYLSGALTILPANMTITASNKTKVYGTLHTFSINDCIVSGLKQGDAVTSVGLSSPGAAANALVSGSPYVISAGSAAGTGLSNYNISYVSGSMNVTAAPLTITASSLSKIYGTALTLSGTEYTVNGLSSWDAVSGVTLTSNGTAVTAQVASSPYSIVPSAAIGTGLENYSISYSDGLLTVTPATLTITANNQSKTYGTTLTLNGSEFTSSGLINGNTITLVNLTSYGLPPTASVTGSPYQLNPSAATGTGLGNYTITYNNGNLTVNKAILTATAEDKTRKYGESNPAFTLAFSGFVNNESQSVIDQLPSVQTNALTSSPVGAYTLTPTGGSDNNYSFNYIPGTLTITKQQQTITITDLPHKIQIGSTHQVSAESTSGLEVFFESLDPGIAAISGNNLTGVAKGSARIKAYHPGDQNYEPAEEIVTIEVFASHKDIMNLFTPDGDGFNDYWELPKMSEWGKCDVRVYNRWGKLVYANPDYSNQWTGTSNGSPLPEGAYYFIINTQNAGVVKGTVNIVR